MTYNIDDRLHHASAGKERTMGLARAGATACLILTIATSLLITPLASAWDWEAHGTLGPGDPTFNRPSTSFPPCTLSSNGTAVYFDVYTESWSGGYAHVEMTGTLNRPVIASYPAGTFNPSDPCAGIFTVGGCEPMPIAFIAPVLGPPGMYDIVVTHCYNGDSGSYDIYMEALLFWDDFENGDLSGWSAHVP